MRHMNRKNLVNLLKMLVTVGLCILLLKNADWATLTELLVNIDLLLVAVVFIILLLSITISTYKWRIILNLHGIFYRFDVLHKIYFIATFFNNFLPTSIGGDGYRVYKTMDNGISRSCSLLAVFVERLSGIAALITVGGISSLYILMTGERSEAAVLVLTASLLFAAGCILFYYLLKYGLLENNRLHGKIVDLIKNNIHYLGDYKSNPRATAWIIVVSLLFHIHNSMTFYLLLNYGVGFDISFAEIYVVLTLTNLISILPISINGIGVVDGAFIYLTGLFGASYDQSLSVMVIARAMLIPLSLIGGAYYFLGKNETRPTNPAV